MFGFWGETVDALQDPKTQQFWTRLMQLQYEAWQDFYPNTPLTELAAPLVGNPWGFSIGGTTLFEPAFEYHQQACDIARFLGTTDKPIVAEIGGGFGGLASFIHRQSPKIRYVGFDLPENAMLQAYYLQACFPRARVLTYDTGLKTISRQLLEEYDFVVLPNFALPTLADDAVDMVVNFRSLAEMPMTTITEYFRQIDRVCLSIFYHENLFKDRADVLHGIPLDRWPSLRQFALYWQAPSRWPRYDRNTSYPCMEQVYLRHPLIHPT